MLWFEVAGTALGAIVQAWRTDADAAWTGTWIGALTGAIGGPALFFGASFAWYRLEKIPR
jgi:hypothetical protein